MSVNHNKHYLYFELTGKSPVLTEIKKIQKAHEEAHEAMDALAKTVHPNAVPLVSRRFGMSMGGISVQGKAPAKIKGWRTMKAYEKNQFFPAKNTKIGKQAEKDMKALDTEHNSQKLTDLIVKHFGKDAINDQFAAATGQSGSYWLHWSWGTYNTRDGDVVLLQLMKTDKTAQVKTPRGMKKVKWSRVMELSEIGEEMAEAAA